MISYSQWKSLKETGTCLNLTTNRKCIYLSNSIPLVFIAGICWTELVAFTWATAPPRGHFILKRILYSFVGWFSRRLGESSQLNRMINSWNYFSWLLMVSVSLVVSFVFWTIFPVRGFSFLTLIGKFPGHDLDQYFTKAE